MKIVCQGFKKTECLSAATLAPRELPQRLKLVDHFQTGFRTEPGKRLFFGSLSFASVTKRKGTRPLSGEMALLFVVTFYRDKK